MILSLIAVVLLAKWKHYKIKYLFYTWTFYPFLISQCILIFFQLSVFWGSYFFVQYASLIKSLCIGVFIFPIIAFEMYKPALAGSVCVGIGSLMNRFVIEQNGGRMPVFPSLSYLTGYVKPGAFDIAGDIHVLGGEGTKWAILTDYIDVGYSILSPGDLLIHFFTFIMFYSLIKAVNLRFDADKKLIGKE